MKRLVLHPSLFPQLPDKVLERYKPVDISSFILGVRVLTASGRIITTPKVKSTSRKQLENLLHWLYAEAKTEAGGDPYWAEELDQMQSWVNAFKAKMWDSAKYGQCRQIDLMSYLLFQGAVYIGDVVDPLRF